ncbi:hypothetical protein ANANG_G00314500 [Anguilla anguilla]|uniref:HMG box-containing protein 1 n=1 Tax=Anguilla anguilla TaxID=7936 RepID=A0A9D3LHH5_ANGAN|nr:hypothetical protein ANANG_G00314500 [Anguilla anguilla]
MATDWSGELARCTMVWQVKTAVVADRVEETQQGALQSAVGMTDAFNTLKCTEHLPSSDRCPSSESHVEYDDLPELQEVQEEVQETRPSPGVFQVEVGVSHQEGPSDTCRPALKSDFPDTNWLTELANIATSPQSPLLQSSSHKRSPPVHIIATSSSLHSYARPPLASSSELSPTHTRSHRRERRHLRARSASESAISCTSSFSGEEAVGWSQSWPPTVWHCFLKGTRVRFQRRRGLEWHDVEDLCDPGDESEDETEMPSHTLKSYGSEGLKLVAHDETVSSGQSVLKLTFDPGSTVDGLLTTECSLGHPFYVKNKGWSSFHPSLTVVQHGIPCYELQLGDLCLPPGHRDSISCDHSVVFRTFRSFHFTPLDSAAVYVLSSMARQRRASQTSGGAVQRPGRDSQPPRPSQSRHSNAKRSHAPRTPSPATPTKCKRPMNAFMLFAKKYRVQYTQMYPGKDNRAISVILGDRWKKMKQEERRTYAQEAKELAEEQKRLNPDCWKRRRTSSEPQQN